MFTLNHFRVVLSTISILTAVVSCGDEIKVEALEDPDSSRRSKRRVLVKVVRDIVVTEKDEDPPHGHEHVEYHYLAMGDDGFAKPKSICSWPDDHILTWKKDSSNERRARLDDWARKSYVAVVKRRVGPAKTLWSPSVGYLGGGSLRKLYVGENWGTATGLDIRDIRSIAFEDNRQVEIVHTDDQVTTGKYLSGSFGSESEDFRELHEVEEAVLIGFLLGQMREQSIPLKEISKITLYEPGTFVFESGGDATDVTGIEGLRTWTDNTGTKKLQAEFIDFAVQIRRNDGSVVFIPMSLLSDEDISLVKRSLRSE